MCISLVFWTQNFHILCFSCLAAFSLFPNKISLLTNSNIPTMKTTISSIFSIAVCVLITVGVCFATVSYSVTITTSFIVKIVCTGKANIQYQNSGLVRLLEYINILLFKIHLGFTNKNSVLFPCNIRSGKMRSDHKWWCMLRQGESRPFSLYTLKKKMLSFLTIICSIIAFQMWMHNLLLWVKGTFSPDLEMHYFCLRLA